MSGPDTRCDRRAVRLRRPERRRRQARAQVRRALGLPAGRGSRPRPGGPRRLGPDRRHEAGPRPLGLFELRDARAPGAELSRRGRWSASSQKAASMAARSSAQSSGIGPPIRTTARAYSSDSDDVGHREVVGVERHPDARLDAGGGTGGPRGSGRSGPGRSRSGTGRARSRADQLLDQVGVVDRQRPVGDALGVDGQRSPDLRRAAPFAGVERDMEADVAGEVDRLGVDLGSGKRASGPARSTRDQAVGDAVGRDVADEVEVVLRRVRAHEGRDQADVDPAGRRRARAPRRWPRPPVGRSGPSACGAAAPSGPPCSGRCRRPCRGRGRPRSVRCLGVLHQRDRQVERAQQVGLVVALVGRDEGAAHPGPGRRRRRGARDRAMSSAVSGRSEPSRWRWSSALGIARVRARRSRGSRSAMAGW